MIFSKPLTLAALLMSVGSAGSAQAPLAPQPAVVKARDVVPLPGPARFFTGRVTVAEIVRPTPPGRAYVGLVTFQPRARSKWHTHPAGQTLYVTEGCGWTQREGRPVQRICGGDAVHVPAGVRHWHGATDRTAMSHLSISETLDGRNVDWAEAVPDSQFRGP